MIEPALPKNANSIELIYTWVQNCREWEFKPLDRSTLYTRYLGDCTHKFEDKVVLYQEMYTII